MKKSFLKLYYDAKEQPTPASVFLDEVAKVTCKSPNTVRMWLTGRQVPDELTKEVLAKHFDTEKEVLFPN